MENKKCKMFPMAWEWVKEFVKQIEKAYNCDCWGENGRFGWYGPNDTDCSHIRINIYYAIYENFDTVCEKIWDKCPFVDEIEIVKGGYNDSPMVRVTFDK